ncbi:MAG: hypothetical protein AAFY66_04245, partial [Pseudomonadota bacterium]
MIVELGHFALILALVVSLFQMSVPLVGAERGWQDWMRAASPATSFTEKSEVTKAWVNAAK